jgi:urea carboxylase
LLRFFDQIRFYPVSESELLKLREEFPLGRFQLEVEESSFSLKQYNEFLRVHAVSIAAFKSTQQSAFEVERERWREAGQADYATDTAVADAAADTELDLPPNGRAVAAHLAGNVWKVPVRPGDTVRAGEPLVIVESMKMEISITAPCAGKVLKVFCREGSPVAAGEDVMILEEAEAD